MLKGLHCGPPRSLAMEWIYTCLHCKDSGSAVASSENQQNAGQVRSGPLCLLFEALDDI